MNSTDALGHLSDLLYNLDDSATTGSGSGNFFFSFLFFLQHFLIWMNFRAVLISSKLSPDLLFLSAERFCGFIFKTVILIISLFFLTVAIDPVN